MKKKILCLILTTTSLFLTSCGNSTTKETKQSQTEDSTQKQEITQNSSSETKEKEEKNEVISLTDKGEFQISHANIKPLNFTIEKDDIGVFSFDWRNDNPNSEKSSFLASTVVINMSQDNNKLEMLNYDEMLNDPSSDLRYEIKKNTSLTLKFKYKLLNRTSPITVTFKTLEGETPGFTFDLPH